MSDLRGMWRVQVGALRFFMVGEPCDYASAVAYAQGIWPDARLC